MNESTADRSYKRYRFPPEVIAHAVWLYFRFALSYRDVEELLAERDVILSYETVRQWCRKFGQTYANELRRRQPQPGDKWHLDEVSWLEMHPAASRGALIRVVQATQDGHRDNPSRPGPGLR